jgi:hypothetical protein
MLTVNPSVYEAMVWVAEQLAPPVPESERAKPGMRIMVDYQDILNRKKEILRDVLVDDKYDKAQRQKARRMAANKKSLDKS